ncbi:unnamed protein product [Ilex paraguariensis]|uniref:Maturase K n=1 Tax=Ilex paraguariensis TaxID=185542 RepID=A0ABC8RM46_9AQUA
MSYLIYLRINFLIIFRVKGSSDLCRQSSRISSDHQGFLEVTDRKNIIDTLFHPFLLGALIAQTTWKNQLHRLEFFGSQCPMLSRVNPGRVSWMQDLHLLYFKKVDAVRLVVRLVAIHSRFVIQALLKLCSGLEKIRRSNVLVRSIYG